MHPINQAMSRAQTPADLTEVDAGLRRNPGEPNAEQSASSEYRKPTIEWKGLTISIENPAGSVRRGRNRHGVTWEQRMAFDYGEIKGTMGVDGDPVDVFLGPYLDEAAMVYVVHQRKVGDWSAYDEDKALIGFDSEESARFAFLACYSDPRFLGPVTAMPVDEFVRKVRATKDKPAMVKGFGVVTLLLKTHVRDYTRADGTHVAAHDDARQAADRHARYAEMFKPSLGIKREDMPQVPNGIKGKFLDELRAKGVCCDHIDADPAALKPTQTDYSAENMDWLTGEARAGRFASDNPILVSADGRVLDGHHRWAVAAMEGLRLPAVKVGLPMAELLKVADEFNQRHGIERRGTTGIDMRAPAMAKASAPMVLFLKAHVGAYVRGGKLVNLSGYQGRDARPAKAPGQIDLFTGREHGATPPLGPNPYRGKDPVKDTPDLFDDAVTEPRSELVAEHKRLVAVLRSPSHADDKAEAKRQAEELREYEKPAAATAPPEADLPTGTTTAERDDKPVLFIKPPEVDQPSEQADSKKNKISPIKQKESPMEMPSNAKIMTKDFMVKKVGRKWIEVTAPGKTFVMQLAITPQTAHLKAGDKVTGLPVGEVRKEDHYGVQVQYFPASPEAAKQADNEKNAAEIARWLGYVEDKAKEGYVYQNGVDKLTALGVSGDALERMRAAVGKAQKIKADQAAARQAQWAKERADRDAKMSAVRQNRMLFTADQHPELDKPVMIGGKPVVFTSRGKQFRIDENHPSIYGHHLLGREGEWGSYGYYRDATPEEAAAIQPAAPAPAQKHWAYSDDAVKRALMGAD